MATDSLRDRIAERSHYDDCAGGSVIRVEDVPAVVVQWLRDEATLLRIAANESGVEWDRRYLKAQARGIEDLARQLDFPEG